MKYTKCNTKEKGNVASWLLVALLAAIVIYLIFSIIKISSRYLEVHNQAASLEKDVAEITTQQQDIQRKMNSQKDPAFLELEARTKFNYQLPGEHVFVFLESTSSPLLENNSLKDKIIFWAGKLGENPKSWAEYFFGMH